MTESDNAREKGGEGFMYNTLSWYPIVSHTTETTTLTKNKHMSAISKVCGQIVMLCQLKR